MAIRSLLKTKIFTCLLLILSGSFSFAGNYNEELSYLRNALQDSKLPDTRLDFFENPFFGPTKFHLNEKNAPWAGNYFPMAQNGIASRWQTRSNSGVRTKDLLTLQDLKNMSQADINLLSPIEKFDIVSSRYDFPATRHELTTRGLEKDNAPAAWEGFCNGVRCAGINMKEPKNPVWIKNAEGIEVRFEIADLKALAGASYFFVEKYSQIGSPTREGRSQSQPNPAVFDIALRNYLASNKKSFVIDSHVGTELWNESVLGYSRKLNHIKELTAAEKALYPWAESKVAVDLTLYTLGEMDIQKSNQTTTKYVSEGSASDTVKTGYTLYLDSKNKARDGVWNPAPFTRGVDFAWFSAGRGADREYKDRGGNGYLKFSIIDRLFQKSQITYCSKVHVR